MRRLLPHLEVVEGEWATAAASTATRAVGAVHRHRTYRRVRRLPPHLEVVEG